MRNKPVKRTGKVTPEKLAWAEIELRRVLDNVPLKNVQALLSEITGKTSYAIVAVFGGVAELAHVENGAQVDILDYDNLKADVETDKSIVLSKGETKYLQTRDREFWKRIRKQVSVV